MKWMVPTCYFLLIRIEYLMHVRAFRSVHGLLRKQGVSSIKTHRQASFERLCHAMDLACALYPKNVLCLQRSAATTLLLRRYGFSAEMVIGAHMNPFRAHAWVEIDGVVVNDKPYMLEIYRQLERC
jgi:Transglutaminase-like superfamily